MIYESTCVTHGRCVVINGVNVAPTPKLAKQGTRHRVGHGSLPVLACQPLCLRVAFRLSIPLHTKQCPASCKFGIVYILLLFGSRAVHVGLILCAITRDNRGGEAQQLANSDDVQIPRRLILHVDLIRQRMNSGRFLRRILNCARPVLVSWEGQWRVNVKSNNVYNSVDLLPENNSGPI